MKKIFNLFMALMMGVTMISLSSCKDDDKSVSAEDYLAPLTYNVVKSDNSVTLTGTNKVMLYKEEYVFVGGVLSSVKITEEIECGSSANAAIIVESVRDDFPEEDGYHVTITQNGSKVVVSGTKDIESYEAGWTMDVCEEMLNARAEDMAKYF